jgi:hypothetical protein
VNFAAVKAGYTRRVLLRKSIMRLRRVLPFAAAAVIAAVAVGFAVQRVPDDPALAPTQPRAAPSTPIVTHAPARAHGFFDMAMTEPAAQPAR